MFAFKECIKLTSVDIPNSVTSLLMGAFAYCSSLKTITIPNSINNIGNAIFYGCTELENVYFDGSIDDWNNNIKNSDLNPMQYASNLYILDSNGNIEYNDKKNYKATI